MCEYCEKGIYNKFMSDIEGTEDAAYINRYNELAVRFTVKPGVKLLVAIPIDCCPKCGRKLNDEA